MQTHLQNKKILNYFYTDVHSSFIFCMFVESIRFSKILKQKLTIRVRSRKVLSSEKAVLPF